MRKRRAPFTIMERDRELWKFVGEHEIASFVQLRQKFWPNSVTNQTAYDRLQKMEKAGYVERIAYQPDPAQPPLRCFRVTRRAVLETDAETASRMYTGPLSDREIGENLKGVDARLALEKQGHKIVGWISERELQREQVREVHARRNRGYTASADTIADGQALIVDPETGDVNAVDVEIDSKHYKRKMLVEKMRGFAGRRVIWATTAKRAATLRQVAPSLLEVVII